MITENDLLSNIITIAKKWWPLIGGGLLALISFVFKKIRVFLWKILSKYLLSHGRRFYYWLSNRSFLTTGNIIFLFPSDIKIDSSSLKEFAERLKGSNYFVNIRGSLINNEITMKLRSWQHIEIKIGFESPKEKLEMYGENTVWSDGKEVTVNDVPENADLKFRWESVLIHYREIKNVLNVLRIISEDTKDKFASIVNRPYSKRSAFFKFFYRKDCDYDLSSHRKIFLENGEATIEKFDKMLSISTKNLDHISQYMPKYLVKESLASILKQSV